MYLNKCEATNVHIHELRKTDQILSNHMNIGCLDNYFVVMKRFKSFEYDFNKKGGAHGSKKLG